MCPAPKGKFSAGSNTVQWVGTVLDLDAGILAAWAEKGKVCLCLALSISLCLLALLTATPGWSATLESPARGALLSGLGFISGWKCNAGRITVRINGGTAVPVAMHQPRADTRSACGGVTNNGFIAQMNWALLGDGEHTITAYDNGVKFASATFEVVTFDEEFVEDAEGVFEMRNFPNQGDTATFEWNESTQHMELADFSSGPSMPDPPPTSSGLGQFIGTWRFTNRITTQTYRFPRLEPCRGNPSKQCLYADGQNAVLGTATLSPYSYLLLHVDGPRCHGYFLEEPRGDRVQGHYGLGSTRTTDSCSEGIATDIALERYPTTGTRLSRSAVSPLYRGMEENISPEIRESVEEAIEEMLFRMVE